MRAISILLCVIFLSSCMSDREFLLRKQQLKNQAAHPSTIDILRLEGPIKIEILEGGKVGVTAPNQPFTVVDIPDGVKSQVDLVNHLITVGAITFIGSKALSKSSGTKTKVINNNAATP